MAVYTEGNYVGDVVKFESPYGYSRETITIESGAGIVKLGTLLGIKTATTKYWPATQAGADGRQIPTAIILETVDATSADQKAVVLTRGPADVNSNKVIFDASFTTQAQKDAALVALKNTDAITFHRGA